MAAALPEVELPEAEFACLREHDLYCKGCLQIYRLPFTLPCLHVLCSECRAKGTAEEEGEDGEVIKKICCAICKTVSPLRTNVNPPNPGMYQASVVEIYWVLKKDLTDQTCQGSGTYAKIINVDVSDNGESSEDTGEADCKPKPDKQVDELTNTAHGSVRVYCLDCSSFLCEACVISHNVEHKSFLPLDRELDYEAVRFACSKRQPRCDDHHDELAPYYCSDCSRALCGKCRDGPHSTHNAERFDVLAVESKKKLAKINENLDMYIEQVHKSMAETQRNREQAEKDIDEAKQMIHERTEALQAHLREQYEAIMAQLELKEQAAKFKNQDKSGRNP